MSFSRMIPFLLLNIIVSAIVVVVILSFWDRRAATPPPSTGVGGSAEITTDSTVIQPVVEPIVQEVVATEAPTAAPAEPSGGPVTHIVAAGELLGNISVQYDVAVDDIVQANGLTDPNQIFVGQELVIPVGGLEQPTAEPVAAAEPTPTDAAPPTAVPTVDIALGESTIEITLITGIGDLASESVQITNVGANTVSLEGWTLTEESGQAYTFGNVNLFPGGAAIQVGSRSAENSGANYYWNLSEAAWQQGETATLRDAGGNVQATYTIP